MFKFFGQDEEAEISSADASSLNHSKSSVQNEKKQLITDEKPLDPIMIGDFVCLQHTLNLVKFEKYESSSFTSNSGFLSGDLAWMRLGLQMPINVTFTFLLRRPLSSFIYYRQLLLKLTQWLL